MKKNKKLKKTNQIVNYRRNLGKNIDLRIIEDMLLNISNRISNEKLYKESSWVYKEYDQLKHTLNALYLYIYNPKESNLSIEDAQVFSSYAINQLKKIKNILDLISKN